MGMRDGDHGREGRDNDRAYLVAPAIMSAENQQPVTDDTLKAAAMYTELEFGTTTNLGLGTTAMKDYLEEAHRMFATNITNVEIKTPYNRWDGLVHHYEFESHEYRRKQPMEYTYDTSVDPATDSPHLFKAYSSTYQTGEGMRVRLTFSSSFCALGSGDTHFDFYVIIKPAKLGWNDMGISGLTELHEGYVPRLGHTYPIYNGPDANARADAHGYSTVPNIKPPFPRDLHAGEMIQICPIVHSFEPPEARGRGFDSNRHVLHGWQWDLYTGKAGLGISTGYATWQDEDGAIFWQQAMPARDGNPTPSGTWETWDLSTWDIANSRFLSLSDHVEGYSADHAWMPDTTGPYDAPFEATIMYRELEITQAFENGGATGIPFVTTHTCHQYAANGPDPQSEEIHVAWDTPIAPPPDAPQNDFCWELFYEQVEWWTHEIAPDMSYVGFGSR